MKIVIQRVTEAELSIAGEVYSSIGQGLMVLLGVATDDERGDVDYLVSKLVGLRVFDDSEGVMNLSVQDTKSEVMVVSQFTLQASTRKGNRPSYIRAARGEVAVPLYEYFISEVERILERKVATGCFGADMQIGLVNDGPVTIVIDSKQK